MCGRLTGACPHPGTQLRRAQRPGNTQGCFGRRTAKHGLRGDEVHGRSLSPPCSASHLSKASRTGEWAHCMRSVQRSTSLARDADLQAAAVMRQHRPSFCRCSPRNERPPGGSTRAGSLALPPFQGALLVLEEPCGRWDHGCTVADQRPSPTRPERPGHRIEHPDHSP